MNGGSKGEINECGQEMATASQEEWTSCINQNDHEKQQVPKNAY